MKLMMDDPPDVPVRECVAELRAETPAPAAEVVTFPDRRHDRPIARFDAGLRIQHVLLMVSFLGLAATGLPLLFSDTRWASWLARLFGGFHAAGVLHRVSATLLIVVFVVHVAQILFALFVRRQYSMLWGPASMVPQPRDVIEMVQHVRWFVGLGPRPKFDHFTYWEKFDYWAVFWGMLIIGGSGLMLWFPVPFSRVVPGWAFNIALLIHGEEALLAVAFIFTIHFFNGHLRPEKFPMDLVIFTGQVTEAELMAERPAEHARLTREGGLEPLVASAPAPRWLATAGRAIGGVAVTVGMMLFALIVFAVLT